MMKHQARAISSRHLIPPNTLNSIAMSLACFWHHIFRSVVISQHIKWWWFPLGTYCKVEKKSGETLLYCFIILFYPLKESPETSCHRYWFIRFPTTAQQEV